MTGEQIVTVENSTKVQITDYGLNKEDIDQLRVKWGPENVLDNTTKEGLDKITEGIKEVREKRFAIEHRRKALKEPITARGKTIDREAKHLTLGLMEIEAPLVEARDEAEAIKEKEKQAKRDAEEKRRRDIKNRIEGFGEYYLNAQGQMTHQINLIMSNLSLEDIDETFEEFQEQAQEAKDKALQKLNELYNSTLAKEEEEERLVEEKKAFEEEKKKEEAERKEREAKEKAEREERENAERIQRDLHQSKINEENAKIKAEQEAERKKLDDERIEQDKRKDAILKEHNEKNRLLREKEEKLEQEKLRLEKDTKDKELEARRKVNREIVESEKKKAREAVEKHAADTKEKLKLAKDEVIKAIEFHMQEESSVGGNATSIYAAIENNEIPHVSLIYSPMKEENNAST